MTNPRVQKHLLVYSVREYAARRSNTEVRRRQLVLFFCPFGIPSRQLALPGMPIWRLQQAGYSVVAYSYPLSIATISSSMTVANIDAIIADCAQRVGAVGNTSEVSCFGTSMGSVLAVNIAARHEHTRKVILNLSYADISEHILTLPDMRTIPRKRLREYIQDAGGPSGLRESFEPYSPVNLIGQLRGKRILLYLSRRDRILKHVHTTQLLQQLRAGGVELEYIENNRGGHYASALTNYLRYKRYIDFLRA